MWAQSKVVAACKSRRDTSRWSLPCWHLDFVLLISRAVRNKCLLFKHSHLWYFVMATQIDEDRYFSCVDSLIFLETGNASWPKMTHAADGNPPFCGLPGRHGADHGLLFSQRPYPVSLLLLKESWPYGPEGGTHLPSLVEEIDFSYWFNLVLRK